MKRSVAGFSQKFFNGALALAFMMMTVSTVGQAKPTTGAGGFSQLPPHANPQPCCFETKWGPYCCS
jgi:hypothetical protein